MDVLHTTRIAPVQQTFRLSRFAFVLDLVVMSLVAIVASFAAWDDWRIWMQPVVFKQVLLASAALWAGKSVLSRRSFRGILTPTEG